MHSPTTPSIRSSRRLSMPTSLGSTAGKPGGFSSANRTPTPKANKKGVRDKGRNTKVSPTKHPSRRRRLVALKRDQEPFAVLPHPDLQHTELQVGFLPAVDADAQSSHRVH